MREGQSNLKNNPLVKDLDHILAHTKGLWEELRGETLFITGGTGFFGCWLLESFVWANDKLDLNMSAVVLTRNSDAFQKKVPHLATHPAIKFHIGDVRTFDFPDGEFSHVIHAATAASAKLNNEDPLLMFDTIVGGTRRTLDFAAQCHARKFLLTSSGGVYGKQPSDMTHISEDYCGGSDPADPRSTYGEGKRAAELLCALYSKKYGIEMKIARCFAFVGPYLNVDIHYAIGNFIRDGLAGGPIVVSGDGTPYRSYLYAADLVIWLWTLLFRGQSGDVYNVGSEDAVTIKNLAYNVASSFQNSPNVIIAKSPVSGQPAVRYVPSVRKAKESLGLYSWIDLEEALHRTIKWHRTYQLD